jgi:hypothetical protein
VVFIPASWNRQDVARLAVARLRWRSLTKRTEFVLIAPGQTHAHLLLVPHKHVSDAPAAIFQRIGGIDPHPPVREYVALICQVQVAQDFTHQSLITARAEVVERYHLIGSRPNTARTFSGLLKASAAVRRVGDYRCLLSNGNIKQDLAAVSVPKFRVSNHYFLCHLNSFLSCAA